MSSTSQAIGFMLAIAIVAVRHWSWRRPARDEPGPVHAACEQRRWLITTAALLTALALVQPRWGQCPAPVLQAKTTAWLCVDVSRSMLARDVSDGRLERAKQLARQLLSKPPGIDCGLIAFAGQMQLLVPPTADTEFLREQIGELSTASAPPGGSDWSAPIRWLIARNAGQPEDAQIAILLTDGGHDPRPIPELAREARRHGVIVFPVGIGDPAVASTIPLPPASTPLTENGQPVRSQLQEAPLQAVAQATGGLYVPARTDRADAADIFHERVLPRARLVESSILQSVPCERFRWLLLPAFLLALAATGRSSSCPNPTFLSPVR